MLYKKLGESFKIIMSVWCIGQKMRQLKWIRTVSILVIQLL